MSAPTCEDCRTTEGVTDRFVAGRVLPLCRPCWVKRGEAETGELLDALAAYITTYVVLPTIDGDEAVVADTLALWVLHTWAFDAWWSTPYLRITSATPDAAKTLLMEVLSSVSRRAWFTVNPSPAVLYRKIDLQRPTLFLDELDNFALDERRDALAVLNAGYKPGAKVPRCKENGDLEEFEVFCPKAYAAIDVRQMPPALLSRSITIRMQTKRADEAVENFIAPYARPRAEELVARCQVWAERNVGSSTVAGPIWSGCRTAEPRSGGRCSSWESTLAEPGPDAPDELHAPSVPAAMRPTGRTSARSSLPTLRMRSGIDGRSSPTSCLPT
jgi:hypothetical protein